MATAQATTTNYAANLQDLNTVPSYTGTNATAATLDPSKAGSYTSQDWNVDSGKTVNGLLGQYMSQDNPLMQQAKTNALQTANSRGLANSSMAVGAGQTAAMNSMLPIAQQDSQTYNTAAQNNQASRNNQLQFNANSLNQVNQQNLSNQQQTSLANQASANQSNQYNAGLMSQAQTSNQNATNSASQFNTQQANAQSQFNASQTNDLLKQSMDMENRTALAGIESTYKTLMQANSSAGELYQQTIKNITDIQGNKDMTAATKASAISNQLTFMQAGVGLIEKMNNMSGLDEILSFTRNTSTDAYSKTTPSE